MACPQLEDGYAQIASELVAAIFIADFPKYEKVILADLLLSLYGPEKLPAAPIDHIRIAGMIGVDPRIVRRGVRSLVAKAVIVEHPGYAYAFVKDWEAWRSESRHDPLIGPGERRFVGHSAARFAARFKSTHKRKKGTNESLHQRLPGTNESPCTSVKGTTWSPMDSDGSSANPATARPLEEYAVVSTTPYILEIKREEEGRDDPDPDAGAGAFIQDEDEGCLTSPPKTVAELVRWLPCITDDPKTVERLRRKVRLWLPRIQARWPEHADAAIDWIQDALIKACDKDDTPSYAEKILAGFVQAGGRPDVELAPPPTPITPSGPSPDGPRVAAARPTKGQLLDAEIARQREAMRMNRIREEAARG